MIALDSKQVLDLYQWLPSYGENSVTCIYKDGNLNVEILYDSNNSDSEEKKTIVFKHACFFSCSSFPGVEMMDIKYGDIGNTGGLNEFAVSTGKDLWSAHYRHLGIDDIRHFFILFLAVNKRIEVFAAEFYVINVEE